MKLGTVVSICLFVLAAVIGLIQLWFNAFDGVLFVKIMTTLGVLFVVVLGVAIAQSEYLSEKKMKDSDYLD